MNTTKKGWKIIKHMMVNSTNKYREGSEDMFQNDHIFIRHYKEEEETYTLPTTTENSKKVKRTIWYYRCDRCLMIRKGFTNGNDYSLANTYKCNEYEKHLIKDIIE
jgi:hypothetical protein